MAGPTPVSALIHAATMVTAGVYMVCRLSFLYDAAPVAAATVAWVGGITALFAATIAVAQTDIKKVLAYSTVSQLGYMFVAAGCAGYSAAIFHLMTHAFFKALLFLGAGAVILAMHHEQDTDKMGGLRSRIPLTWGVFLVGVLAIAGVPPLSGFFSKDEILLAAWTSHVPGHRVLWLIGLVTAGITSFYMFRVYFRTFHGECRAPREVQEHIEEPAETVTYPLVALAFLSFFGGIIGLPQVYGDAIGIAESNSLALFLAPVVGEVHHEISHAAELGLAALAVAVAGAGALLAWLFYVRQPDLPGRFRASATGLWRLVANKYWVDEAIDAAIVRPMVTVSDKLLYQRIDAGLIDGAGVNGVANTVRAAALGVFRHLQSGLTQSYLFLMIVGTVAVVGWLVL
jgi:NADH-quinone oxidoreductase subunit L